MDDFPTPAPPTSRALVPRCNPPPSSASNSGAAALHELSDKRSVMFGGHKPGEDFDASCFNNEIVIATPKFDARAFF